MTCDQSIERLIFGGKGTLNITQYGFSLYDNITPYVDEPLKYQIKLNIFRIVVSQKFVEINRVIYYRQQSKCRSLNASMLADGRILILDGHHRLMAKLFSGYNYISVKSY